MEEKRDFPEPPTMSNDNAKKEQNILILGQTGVGKSTFINAFSNYMQFKTLDEALTAEKIHALIPSKFTMVDESYNSRTIEVGMDTNESFKEGKSSTQACRTYSFETQEDNVRLIDTPGIGDTDGVNKDQVNFQNLLHYLSEFNEIHAIIIILKPNDSKLTVEFNYCIKELFASLDRSAADNIVFLFTNSRATFYRPGDTVGPLREILKTIKETPPNVDIRFSQENTFCMDSEAFRFLLAKREGYEFPSGMKQSFYDSWNTSAEASNRLLMYVRNLKPHRIQNTISLMSARRSIERLRKPLSEISVLIEDNLNRIKRSEENLMNTTKTIKDLQQFLLVPIIKLRIIKFEYPRTVCAHTDCKESHIISDATSYHYKQICHKHCYLSGVPENVIGDARLQQCQSMITKNGMKICKLCNHSFLEHMHIYYATEPYEELMEDSEIASKLTTKQSKKNIIENELVRYKRERVELEDERKIIQTAVAKFAHFLTNSAIIPFNDAYKGYLEYLIENEKKQGDRSKPKRIEDLEQLISNYEYEKSILMDGLKKAQEVNKNVKSIVDASEIINIIEKLYSLKFSGQMIKEMNDAQQQHIKTEVVKKTETVVEPIGTEKGVRRVWNALKCYMYGTGNDSENISATVTEVKPNRRNKRNKKKNRTNKNSY